MFSSVRTPPSPMQDYFQHTTDGAYDMHRDSSPRCGEGCSQPAWDLRKHPPADSAFAGILKRQVLSVLCGPEGQYSTTVFTEEAVRIVKAHDVNGPPLFLYLAYQVRGKC